MPPCLLQVTETNQVGSAACCNKSQSMRQVLLPKKRGLFRCWDLENGGLPSQRPSPLLVKAYGSYRDRERRAFFLNTIILLAFGLLGPYLFISLAIGTLSARTSPFAILANGGDSPALPDCLR